MSNETKRLYRSRYERKVAGVCGGLGEFLGIDPTIIRLAFIGGFLVWPGPLVPLAYLALMIVVPEEPVVA
jgi:phage shock protein C